MSAVTRTTADKLRNIKKCESNNCQLETVQFSDIFLEPDIFPITCCIFNTAFPQPVTLSPISVTHSQCRWKFLVTSIFTAATYLSLLARRWLQAIRTDSNTLVVDGETIACFLSAELAKMAD